MKYKYGHHPKRGGICVGEQPKLKPMLPEIIYFTFDPPFGITFQYSHVDEEGRERMTFESYDAHPAILAAWVIILLFIARLVGQFGPYK
jgi:hypothetical protein